MVFVEIPYRPAIRNKIAIKTPFVELVKKAKVEGVMGAYNRVNGEPSCASEFLMGKLDKWGFYGYFVSDCWAIRDFQQTSALNSWRTASGPLCTAKCFAQAAVFSTLPLPCKPFTYALPHSAVR